MEMASDRNLRGVGMLSAGCKCLSEWGKVAGGLGVSAYGVSFWRAEKRSVPSAEKIYGGRDERFWRVVRTAIPGWMVARARIRSGRYLPPCTGATWGRRPRRGCQDTSWQNCTSGR